MVPGRVRGDESFLRGAWFGKCAKILEKPFLSWIQVGVIIIWLASSNRECKGAQLNQKIFEIDGKRKGSDTDTKSLEAEYLALLKEYKTAEEKGEIYSAIALMYASAWMREPHKVLR